MGGPLPPVPEEFPPLIESLQLEEAEKAYLSKLKESLLVSSDGGQGRGRTFFVDEMIPMPAGSMASLVNQEGRLGGEADSSIAGNLSSVGSCVSSLDKNSSAFSNIPCCMGSLSQTMQTIDHSTPAFNELVSSSGKISLGGKNHLFKNSSPNRINQAPDSPVFKVKTDWKRLFMDSNEKKFSLSYMAPSSEGGRIVVKPSKEVMEEGAKVWENAVVGQFLGKCPPFFVMKRILNRVWGKKCQFEIFSIAKGAYFFKFDSQDWRNEVLDKGIWVIAGLPMVVQKWRPNINNCQLQLKSIPIWVKLHNVPSEFWSEAGISCVASAVGNPLYADSSTEKGNLLSYMRVCVEMDVNSQFPQYFDIEAEGNVCEIRVEYAWKPSRCRKCLLFGHSGQGCRALPRAALSLDLLRSDSGVKEVEETLDPSLNEAPITSPLVPSAEILDPGFSVVKARSSRAPNPPDPLPVTFSISSPNPFSALEVNSLEDDQLASSSLDPRVTSPPVPSLLRGVEADMRAFIPCPGSTSDPSGGLVSPKSASPSLHFGRVVNLEELEKRKFNKKKEVPAVSGQEKSFVSPSKKSSYKIKAPRGGKKLINDKSCQLEH